MSSAMKKPKKAYAIAISSFAAMKTPIISFNSKPAIHKAQRERGFRDKLGESVPFST